MLRLKRNWSEYNKALVNRGNITFWIDEKAIQKWKAPHQKHKKGRPFMFFDEAIKTALAVRFVYSLPLRSLEGFLRAFFKCLEVLLAVPSYTQICKRMRKLPYEQHFSLKKKAAHMSLIHLLGNDPVTIS